MYAISVVSIVVGAAQGEISNVVRKGMWPDSSSTKSVTFASLVHPYCADSTPIPLTALFSVEVQL